MLNKVNQGFSQSCKAFLHDAFLGLYIVGLMVVLQKRQCDAEPPYTGDDKADCDG